MTSLQLKFARYDAEGESIRVGFKMPDGTKQEYNFPHNSTVRVCGMLIICLSLVLSKTYTVCKVVSITDPMMHASFCIGNVILETVYYYI